MPLYFITGISGSGKSSLVHELRNRSHEAYDTDDDGFSKWQHKETGFVHPKSSVKAADRTPEFLANHSWNIPRNEVEELQQRATDKPIFLCGVIDNADELHDLFEARFALVIDDQTLTQRLQTRTNNDWGKQAHELQATLARQRELEEYYASSGFTTIDATESLETVASFILARIN